MTDLASVRAEAAELVKRALAAKLRIATAESCTGGLVAGAITDIPGSSEVLDRGLVTYSNRSKTELLGVPAELIERLGAVSEEVAIAMAEGVLANSGVDLAVAITGIAGPGGGTAEKPVGLVHFAVARHGHPTTHAVHAFADLGREAIRLAAVREALRLLTDAAAT